MFSKCFTCYVFIYYYYYYYLFIYFSLESTQPITPNGSTQPIKNPTNTTSHGKLITATDNHGKPQPKTATHKPMANPQISQTQNNQKIKRETTSDRRDREPNSITAKPTLSCWPPRDQIWSARSQAQRDPREAYLESLRSARERKFIEKRRRRGEGERKGERNYESLCKNERKEKWGWFIFNYATGLFWVRLKTSKRCSQINAFD